MALIDCPECEKRVSDRAKVCPQCGYSLADEEITGNETISTIQLTSKKLKLQGCLAQIVFLIGFILVGLGGKAKVSSLSKFGFWLVVISIVWFLITRIRIWWNHE